MATFTNIRLMHSLCICLCCSIRAHSDTASTSCISICAHILRMQLHLNAFGDRPRIKYADTMRYKLQECYQMHVECISCAHMRSECAVLPTVRMHSMRGGIKKLTYHGGELGWPVQDHFSGCGQDLYTSVLECLSFQNKIHSIGYG